MDSNILVIDRNAPFDVKMVRPKGDFDIVAEEEKSLQLREIDISEMFLLQNGVLPLPHDILLDARVAETLFQHPEIFPNKWKEPLEDGSERVIFFQGTKMCPHHCRGEKWPPSYVVILYWSCKDNCLRLSYNCVSSSWPKQGFTAVLRRVFGP